MRCKKQNAGRLFGASATFVFVAIRLAGETAAYHAPRAEGGKPDLNGIWQVLSEANKYVILLNTNEGLLSMDPPPPSAVPAGGVRSWPGNCRRES